MNAPDLAPPPPVDAVRTVERLNRALFFVGALFALVGLRFFIFPEQLAQTTVGHALPGFWDETWSALFIVGGTLLMIGQGTRRPRVELPGLTLLSTAVLVYAGAVLFVTGTRGLIVAVLCTLAVWVFDGRRRDIRDVPCEQRHGQPDTRPPASRVERRLELSFAPLVIFGASSSSDILVSALVALLGGGIVTAIAQAVLVKPQRRDLEGRLSQAAVETADVALRQSNQRADALAAELAAQHAEHVREVGELRGELKGVRDRCYALERVLIEHKLPVPGAPA